jgi:phosphatidylserine/phosphatidylglycerophosphate/cardiolipin synthase-like enzyme
MATPDAAESLSRLIPAPAFGEVVEDLLNLWRANPETDGTSLGVAIAAAAHAHALARRSSDIELVVSGPTTEVIHARRTEQVLLQMIDGATREILLITFALQMHDELRQALVGALGRNVAITVVAEDPADHPAFRGHPQEALHGLGVRRLRWPQGERARQGVSLHAKVVVADRAVALITSANLTEYAASDNLEAGALIHGTDTAQRLVEHIDELERRGILKLALPGEGTEGRPDTSVH